MTRPEGDAAFTGQATPGAAVTYEIRVAGHLDDHWAVTLGDLDLVRLEDGTTSLTGPVLDQAQLHGLLARVRDLGVPLLAVRAASDRSVTASAAAAPPDEQVKRVWGGAVRLGAGRVLRSGRWLRLRATACCSCSSSPPPFDQDRGVARGDSPARLASRCDKHARVYRGGTVLAPLALWLLS